MAVCCPIQNSSVVSGDGLLEGLHRIFRGKKSGYYTRICLVPWEWEGGPTDSLPQISGDETKWFDKEKREGEDLQPCLFHWPLCFSGNFDW